MYANYLWSGGMEVNAQQINDLTETNKDPPPPIYYIFLINSIEVCNKFMCKYLNPASLQTFL